MIKKIIFLISAGLLFVMLAHDFSAPYPDVALFQDSMFIVILFVVAGLFAWTIWGKRKQ